MTNPLIYNKGPSIKYVRSQKGGGVKQKSMKKYGGGGGLAKKYVRFVTFIINRKNSKVCPLFFHSTHFWNWTEIAHLGSVVFYTCADFSEVVLVLQEIYGIGQL